MVHDCGSWVILQITRFPLSSLTRSLTTPQSTSLSACALRDVCASQPHLRAGAHSETWSVEETVLQKACFWQDYAGCSSVSGKMRRKTQSNMLSFSPKVTLWLSTSYTSSHHRLQHRTFCYLGLAASTSTLVRAWYGLIILFPFSKIASSAFFALFFEENPSSYEYNLLVRHTLMGFYNLWRITPLVLNVWRLRAPTFFMFMG